MNAGYGKNSPKVLNLTRELEFHHKDTKDTKTDYLQKGTKLTKVNPLIGAMNFSALDLRFLRCLL